MILNKLRLLKSLWHKLGTLGVLRFLYARYIGWGTGSVAPKRDVVAFYEFLRHSPFGEEFTDSLRVEEKSVNWVIPDFGIGSGGHINIFRLIAGLERLGFRCRVVIVGRCQFSSAEEAYKCICNHFTPIEAAVSIGDRSMAPAWITVATSWITAYAVRNFRSTAIRCYFVQDYEPYFYAHGTEYAAAEMTYRFGFYGITAGGWLADKLAREHGMRTTALGFSYDRGLYRPLPRRNSEKRRVFFYARPVTARRGFELGLLVLAEVAARLPRVEFVLAGWDTSDYTIPFPHLNAGNVALKELPDLYSQCDAALVLSFTNLSLLPLELMACGCPVVSNRGPNVEWLLNPDIAVLADPTVEALSDALVRLLTDEDHRRRLIRTGLAFAQATDWSAEAETVAQVMAALMEGGTGTPGELRNRAGTAAVPVQGRVRG